jgi:hypothetical protein
LSHNHKKTLLTPRTWLGLGGFCAQNKRAKLSEHSGTVQTGLEIEPDNPVSKPGDLETDIMNRLQLAGQNRILQSLKGRTLRTHKYTLLLGISNS